MKSKYLWLLLPLCFLLAGCDQTNTGETNTSADTNAAPAAPSAPATTNDTGAAPATNP